MNRLTARTEKGLAYLVNVKPDEQAVDSPHKNTLQCILDCFERLAHYEDLEEQGRLLVLPCKVGDTVYVDARTFSYGEYSAKRHAEALVTSFTFGRMNFVKLRIFAPYVNQHKIFKYSLSSFGKTVFLTREEAEAALKGAEQ